MWPGSVGRRAGYQWLSGTCFFAWEYMVASRCRANVAHIRQSRPDSGLGFQVKVLKTFKDVPSSLESGACRQISGGFWQASLGPTPRGFLFA